MPRQAHQSAAKRFRSTGSFRGTSSVPKHGSLAAEVSPWPKIPSGLVSNRAPDAINTRSRGAFSRFSPRYNSSGICSQNAVSFDVVSFDAVSFDAVLFEAVLVDTGARSRRDRA
jgi:hypothetical protein